MVTIEIYAGSVRKIPYTIYANDEAVLANGDVTWTLYDRSGEVLETKTASGGGEFDQSMEYYVTIGQDITNSFEERSFDWSYEIEVGDDTHQIRTPKELLIVVNPYTTYSQFTTYFPGSDISRQEFPTLEPVARKVIERYCNQVFTKETNKPYTVAGQSSDMLLLPKRLIKLHEVDILDDARSADGTPTPYSIADYVTFDDDDRWMIRRRTSHANPRGMTPVSRRHLFKYPTRYRIIADWGWEHVPQDIVMAASILIDDYASWDAKYREKYIANIRAGDWRMEFTATGDETTGNANVDMILGAYRNIGLAVI